MPSRGRDRRAPLRALLSQRLQAAATKLTRLHLSDAVDTRVARAQEGQVGDREVLDLGLKAEVGRREGRRVKQALTLAGLPSHTTRDDVACAFQPDLAVVRVTALATLRCVEPKAQAICLGPLGTGTTQLAVALALAAGPRGFSIDFPPGMIWCRSARWLSSASSGRTSARRI
jgi:DNA replication protein DnaC